MSRARDFHRLGGQALKTETAGGLLLLLFCILLLKEQRVYKHYSIFFPHTILRVCLQETDYLILYVLEEVLLVPVETGLADTLLSRLILPTNPDLPTNRDLGG